MRLNGLEFHVETSGGGPPLVLLHGFTGSARAWDDVRPALSEFATVVAVDMLGHGGSAAPDQVDRYALERSAGDLAALIDALGFERADVLGYSMGGRIALHFAVHASHRVRRLVLESATPGIEDAGARHARAEADAALASRIERDGIEAFVDEWERQPLLQLAGHVPADVHAAQHALRLRNAPRGLAQSLRGMGTGQQTPLWSDLPHLAMPVRLIVGELDRRYCQIAERMRSLLPWVALDVVAEAGHTVHVDQPAAFVSHVRAALGQPAQSRN